MRDAPDRLLRAQPTPIPHYDLTADRRALAMRLGAIEATYREIALLVRGRRIILST
ncbi:MAG: hypothetical protein K2X38_23910 [Gemmataceae bacterium]|nr:hypothetical protein [Gemmataceae bacterium]